MNDKEIAMNILIKLLDEKFIRSADYNSHDERINAINESFKSIYKTVNSPLDED